MDKKYSTGDILKKARELSKTLQQHPISSRYFSLLSEMSNNQDAQVLLQNLVSYGQNLNNKIHQGEPSIGEEYESEIPFDPDNQNLPLVKEFINAQKEYLALVSAVMDKIENPDKKIHRDYE
jgi:cell fate (sporulation/competence/biofilm development) regulator YlbF (YheA/YmcA/DUF963 family)